MLSIFLSLHKAVGQQGSSPLQHTAALIRLLSHTCHVDSQQGTPTQQPAQQQVQHTQPQQLLHHHSQQQLLAQLGCLQPAFQQLAQHQQLLMRIPQMPPVPQLLLRQPQHQLLVRWAHTGQGRHAASRKPHKHRHNQPPPQQQQQQLQPPLSYTIHPAQMTHLIMSAEAPRDLLQLIVRHHQALNHIHIIAALNRAAALWPSTATPGFVPGAARPGATHIDQQQQVALDAASTGGSSSSSMELLGRQQLRKLMLQLSGPFMKALSDLGAREISSALWSYAHCELQPPPELMTAVVQELCSWDKLQQAPLQYVINLSWAAAKLDCRDPQLYSRIAAAVLPGQLQQLTPSQLAVLAWSCTRAHYQDTALGAAVTARALQLVQKQLEQRQTEHKKNKGKRKLASLWQFSPGSLSGLIWGSTAMGWLQTAPELLQKVAVLARQEPFVFEFTSRAAANLLWGFAVTSGGSDSENNSSIRTSQHSPSSSSMLAGPESVHLQQQQQGAGIDRQLVWEASLAVAAAALRRPDEAESLSLSRLLWATASLHDWRQQQLTQLLLLASAPPSARAAGAAPSKYELGQLEAAAAQVRAEGQVVFEQLCAQLSTAWQQQPDSLVSSAVVAAWALSLARKQGLLPVRSSPSAAVAAGQSTALANASELLLLQLANRLVRHIRAEGRKQQQPLPAGAVADLAAAFANLSQRLPVQSDQPEGSAPAGGSDQGQSDAGSSEVATALSAAVDALAAAAWQYAGVPGALQVQDVSRMLASFARLEVNDNALYHDLLQHWSQEALRGCNSESLVGAVRAASTFAAACQDLMRSGTLPGHTWEHLLLTCLERWPALTAEEQSRLRPAVKQLCGQLLVGVVPQQLLDEMKGACRLSATGPKRQAYLQHDSQAVGSEGS